MFRFLPQFHLATLLLLVAAAQAEDVEGFSEGPNGALLHARSGFMCPLKIGPFERDAAGRRDPERDSDYCAYSALSGVYGTIVIMPLGSTFDPKESSAAEFPGMGGTVVGETVQPLGAPGASLPVYLRTTETARLESLHYRTLFADAAVGAWSVEVIVEYADPRDREAQTAFLNNVYAAAQRELGAAAAQ